MTVTNDPAGTPDVPRRECPHCDVVVPVGTFCGNCGANFSNEGGPTRAHQFAAAPGEHVTHVAVISTLFPHLPHRHAHLFREALVIGLALVVLLAAIRLFTPALLLAAVLLPILYLLYLYEVEVYESEPLTVLLATFGTGVVLGVAYVLVVSHLLTPALNGALQGPLIVGVLLPMILQALMLVGPLLLLSRPRFDEALDGLTFGVTSALGFTMAAVITSNWHVLTAPLVGSSAVSAESIIEIVRAAILVALVNAGTTATITTALWLRYRTRTRSGEPRAVTSLPLSAAIGFGAQILLGIAGYFAPGPVPQLIIWAAAAGLLLVWLRLLIHHALLQEGEELAVGPLSPCPECHRLVPTMRFCPACGVARSAGPKHARAQSTREAHALGG